MHERVYSVGKVNTYIKNLLGSDFILKNIAVRGEISNCRYNHSGHIYFSLKDETGVLSAVIFASCAVKLKLRLEDGMSVVAKGRIGVYEKSGTYQLYVNEIEKEGKGDLYKRFEELKERLLESGMFAEEYKQPIPKYSMNIGVVTAKTGAVINDIRNVSKRRNPYAKITLFSAKVQGEGAAQEICKGIETLDMLGLDCIIIGRGGGSIEDLWAFNEECVARAIFNCKTPVISAVGHETDFTIADFAADLRAPTPSAAAELAVFDYNRFVRDLKNYRYTLNVYMRNAVSGYKERAKLKKLLLEKLSPENAILTKRHSLADYSDLLERQMEQAIEENKEKLSPFPQQLERYMDNALKGSKEHFIRSSARLEGLSPLKRLSEGYAFVEDKEGRGLRSVSQAAAGEELGINVIDGKISAEVKKIWKKK